MPTNAQLTQQINGLLASWNAREEQFRAWLAGTASGGPNSDGRYPLSDASGDTQLVDSPAKLADTVGGPAGLSYDAQLLSEAARDTTITARDVVLAAEAAVNSLHTQTISARDLAQLYRDDAAAYAAALASGKAAAEAAQTAAEAAAAAAATSEANALTHADDAIFARDDAQVAAADAAVSRDLAASYAASINPANLVTTTALQASLDALVDAAPGTLDTLNELAAALGDDPNFATTMTNALAGKSDLGHTHAIADVTGLQTALAGKQPVGAYAQQVHSHTISEVSGLQTALDGKQPVGSYSVTGHTHLWADITDKPSTFTPSAHTHSIGDVTGLQGALDAKITRGSVIPVDGSGASSAMAAYVSFRDNGGTERGWIGFGEGNTVMRVRNTLGELRLESEGGQPVKINGVDVLASINAKANLANPDFSGRVDFDGGTFVNGNGDIHARRDNGGTGVVYFADGGNKYLYFDGGGYYFGGSYPVIAGSEFVAGGRNIVSDLNQTFRPQNYAWTSLGSETVEAKATIDNLVNNKLTNTPLDRMFFETSTDGVNWSAASLSDTNKKRLLRGDISGDWSVPSGTPYFRVRLRATGYTFVNSLYLHTATQGNNMSVVIKYKQGGGGGWVTQSAPSQNINTWPGHTTLNFGTLAWHEGDLNGYAYEIAIEFTPTWNNGNHIVLNRCALYGSYPFENRKPYIEDQDGNIGIGATPNAKLEVNGSVRFVDSGGAGPDLLFGNIGGSTCINNVANARTYIGAYETVFTSYDNSTEHMRITSAGSVGIGTSSPNAKLSVAGTAKIGEGAATNSAKLMVNTASGAAAGLQLFQDGVESWIIQNPASSTALTFSNSGTERMRIDSSGNVGVGTSSPQARIHANTTLIPIKTSGPSSGSILQDIYVTRTSSGTSIQSGPNITFEDGTTNNSITVQNSQGNLTFWNYGGGAWAERMRIDSSGNVGLGVTPSAWSGQISSAIEGKAGGSIAFGFGTAPVLYLSSNYFFNGTNGVYKQDGFAAQYAINNNAGDHRWYTAPSGTAGNAISFTQAMTLDTSGNLLVGTTSNPDSSRMVVSGGSITHASTQLNTRPGTATQYEFVNRNGAGFDFYVNNASNLAARIDSSGRFGVGTTSPTATIHSKNDGSLPNLTLETSAATGSNFATFRDAAAIKAYFGFTSASTENFELTNLENGAMVFGTNNAERMRLDSSGNVGIGTSSPSAKLDVNGNIESNGGVVPYHGNTAYGSAKITVSTSAPSGGADGDVWFKV